MMEWSYFQIVSMFICPYFCLSKNAWMTLNCFAMSLYTRMFLRYTVWTYPMTFALFFKYVPPSLSCSLFLSLSLSPAACTPLSSGTQAGLLPQLLCIQCVCSSIANKDEWRNEEEERNTANHEAIVSENFESIIFITCLIFLSPSLLWILMLSWFWDSLQLLFKESNEVLKRLTWKVVIASIIRSTKLT